MPSEIRNRIYQLVLGGNTIHVAASCYGRQRGHALYQFPAWLCKKNAVDDEAVELFRYSKTTTEVPRYHRRHPECFHKEDSRPAKYSCSLIRTCRQTHREAALLPFQINTFSFTSSTDLRMWLPRLMAKQQRAIACIELGYWNHFRRQPRMKNLIGLKKLTLSYQMHRPQYIHETDADYRARESIYLHELMPKNLKEDFKNATLSSATVCIYRNPVHPSFSPGGIPQRMHPQAFASASEAAEAALMANRGPVAQEMINNRRSRRQRKLEPENRPETGLEC